MPCAEAGGCRYSCPDGDRYATTVSERRVGKWLRPAAGDAAGDQHHDSRVEEIVRGRPARRRLVEKTHVITVPAEQRLALRHAGRIDAAPDLLRQLHGLIAIQAAEGDLRMRFEDAAAQI